MPCDFMAVESSFYSSVGGSPQQIIPALYKLSLPTELLQGSNNRLPLLSDTVSPE